MADSLDFDHDEPLVKKLKCSNNDSVGDGSQVDVFDGATQPYSLEEESAPESDIGEANKHSTQPFISQVGLTGGNGSNIAKLGKVVSVQKDAQQVADFLGLDCVDLIYNKIQQKRSIPNRINVITNEILENGLNGEDSHDEIKDCAQDLPLSQVDEIFSDIEQVVYTLKENHPTVKYDPNRIYELLELHSNSKDRVGAVIALLLGSKACTEKDTDNELANDVSIIMRSFPNADANYVFELLEKNHGKENKVELVIDQLVGEREKQRMKALHDEFCRPETDNPLLRDMHIVSKIFPDVDRQEIYAYLEAHHDRNDRIQVVTDEFLRMQGSNKTDGMDYSEPSDDLPCTAKISSPLPQNSNITDDVETLKIMFPDCDPNYLFEKLDEMEEDKDRCNKLTNLMLKNQDYPKLIDSLEIQMKQKAKPTQEVNILTLLQAFPDPKATFYDEEKVVSVVYKNHAFVALKNSYPMLTSGYIKKKLNDHKGHYCPTLRDLEKSAAFYLRNEETAKHRSRYRKKPRPNEPLPEEQDEYFHKETQFAEREPEILGYIQLQKDEKIRRFEAAKSNGELQECGCCFDDEVLFEDMTSCPEGHLFCKECVRRSSEEVIGQGRLSFPCLTGDSCSEPFPMTVLQQVLPSNTLSLLLRRIQEDEINKAGIEDLVSCPFCSFATIMPNQDDKVLRCLNPECLKESCRLCKEPSHIPLRCDEVEKQGETSMRTFIETRMSEAMLRTCWRCKKRFFKTEGCNKMTCTCGASMCYVCREPIQDYSHFGLDGCPQDTDVMKLHAEEMAKAAEEARERFKQDHPEATDISLKYDPVKILENMKNKQGGVHDLVRFDGDYDEGDYDDEEDYMPEDDEDEEYNREVEDEEFQRAIQHFYKNK